MSCRPSGLRQRAGFWTVILLMTPILALVWVPAKEPFLSVACGEAHYLVLSGRLFTDPFGRIHAGFCMDQPTIGKGLFWFSAASAISLPYAAVARWLSRRTIPPVYRAYAALTALLCTFLLSMLIWPLCRLIQYVISMGITVRRVCGLAYAIPSVLAVVGFLGWSLQTNRTRMTSCFRPCVSSRNGGSSDGCE